MRTGRKGTVGLVGLEEDQVISVIETGRYLLVCRRTERERCHLRVRTGHEETRKDYEETRKDHEETRK